MKLFVLFLIFIMATATVFADLIIYPAKNQSKEQQYIDKGECRDWAIKETGINPDDVKNVSSNVNANAEGTGVKGAATGALVGGAVGSLDGNFGKGAAAGAIVGGAVGVISRHRKERKAKATSEQIERQKKELLEKYNKAYSACLEAKGYTVKY
jgi:uncharacterized protein YcfJ